MPDLNALTNPDGFDDIAMSKSGALSSGMAAIRDSGTASSITNSQKFINVNHAIIGFGLTSGFISRGGLGFDLSGNDNDGSSISGNTVVSANLVLRSMPDLTGGFATILSNTGNNIYACKCNDSGTSFDTASYSALDGYVSSGSYDGNVTVYGTANEAANSEISITLNSTCISDINSKISSGGKLLILLLCQDDFLFNTSSGGLGSPTGGTGFFGRYEGLRIYSTQNDVSQLYKPKLELTYGAAAATDNATFFGTNF